MTAIDVFTEWVRLFSYSTIMLCVLFELKMKRYSAIILMGDFMIAMTLLVSLLQVKIGADKIGVRTVLLTVSVFIWMLIHLYNTLRINHH